MEVTVPDPGPVAVRDVVTEVPEGGVLSEPESGRKEAAEQEPERDTAHMKEVDANLATRLGKPKVTAESSGRLGALLGGRSILTADAAEAGDGEIELEDLSGLQGDYDETKVKEAWAALVENIRGQNKQGLAATLSHGTLVFNDPVLKLTVANQIQYEELKECATQLLHFVRSHVGNGRLAFEVEVGEVEVKVAFLTPKDRYLQWASEKPALEALRSRLDLDLP